MTSLFHFREGVGGKDTHSKCHARDYGITPNHCCMHSSRALRRIVAKVEGASIAVALKSFALVAELKKLKSTL